MGMVGSTHSIHWKKVFNTNPILTPVKKKSTMHPPPGKNSGSAHDKLMSFFTIENLSLGRAPVTWWLIGPVHGVCPRAKFPSNNVCFSPPSSIKRPCPTVV